MPSISGLVDSDMEGNNTNFIDENSLISSASDATSITETKAAAAKKQPKKRKVIATQKKPRAKAMTTAERKPTGVAGRKRKAAEEDEVEESELVETELVKPRRAPAKVTKPTKSTKTKDTIAKKTSRTKPSKKEAEQEVIEEDESVPSPIAMRSNFNQTKTTKPLPKPVAATKSRRVAPKTQRTIVDTVSEIVSDMDEEGDEATIEQPPPTKRARTESCVRQEAPYRRRAGSASDTERGDPMLRRKLGDITRKFENVDLKYRSLKDVAIGEANANVEKLRKQCETITEASNKLVSSLKKELAQQAPMIQESRKIKRDVQTQAQAHEAEMNKLRTANSELTATLSAAQNEIKTLQIKLAAARATPALADVKPPITTTKSAVPVKTALPASGQSEKIAQRKIELYADLTGMDILSVTQAEDGDKYECIQTGRNGTLHFRLFIDSESAKRTDSKDIEYLYTPVLDPNRDQALIEVMPDYLCEDITFEKDVAAKFYQRVVKTMTEKPTIEDEE